MHTKYSKIIISSILGLLVGITATYLIMINQTRTVTKKEVACTYSERADFHDVSYVSAIVAFEQSSDDYLIEISIKAKDSVDMSQFSNQNVYVSVTFDGLIPFSTSEYDYNYFKIPLENGKIPSDYTIRITKDNDLFKGENLTKLNEFLEGKVDYLAVGIDVFNPDGNILMVCNSIVNR